MKTTQRRTSLALIVGALLLAACSSKYGYSATPAKMGEGILTDEKGMTLYIFDKDEAGTGKSMCNGQCASNWPPLYATDSDKAMGDWSVVTRDDGKKQWAYKGKPLYLWIKDKMPGDRTGDGVANAWRLAKP